MMRKILLFVLLAIPLFAISQNREKLVTINPIYQNALPLENGLITFSTVVQVESVKKDELYLRAHEWIIKSFNSAKDVIQLDDKDAGKIVCKTLTTQSAGKGIFGKVVMDIYYLLTIEARDERYKITASNFTHHYNKSLGPNDIEGQNQFEEYFLLKHPSKKEENLNMEMASNLSIYIWAIIEAAEIEIKQPKNDDW